MPSSIELPHPWGVLRAWPSGHVVALSAGPGAGKSTLAALLKPDHWWTCEQTAEQAAILLDRARPGGVDGSVTIYAFGRGDGGAAIRRLEQLPAGFVVVDSITAAAALDEQVSLVARIVEWARRGDDRRALVILGQTSDGTAAGRVQLRHVVDVDATIAGQDDGARVLATQKNRAGPLGSAYFSLTSNGAAIPAFPYSYSVESIGGAFRLVPYPTDGPQVKWDGVLRHRFKGRPAEPGYASAGRVVPGYPSDRLQPADVSERRAFAEAHGLRWLE